MDREIYIPVRSLVDLVNAREQGRILAHEIGFTRGEATMVAAVISELARNIVQFAKEGEVRLSITRKDRRAGIHIVASDHGPGIHDIDKALEFGFTTDKGLGIGLTGSKNWADEFKIDSKAGAGTTITLTKWAS